MIWPCLLSAGRSEVPSGMYSISGGDELHKLNLSIPNKGYVVGLYDAPDGKSQLHSFMYTTEKTENGASRIYLMVPAANNGHIHLVDNSGELISSTELKTGLFVDILPPIISSPDYKLYFGSASCTGKDCPNHIDFKVQMGSVSVLHIQDSTMENDLQLLVRPNTVSILWVIPQYIVITLGEVLLSVTALEFAYSQSAPNMKSVLQALWLLTVFLGNVIDMAISGSHVIPEPATELFVYAFLMFMVMGVFILLAMRYKYVDEDDEDDQDDKSSSSKEEKTHPLSTEEDTSC